MYSEVCLFTPCPRAKREYWLMIVRGEKCEKGGQKGGNVEEKERNGENLTFKGKIKCERADKKRVKRVREE